MKNRISTPPVLRFAPSPTGYLHVGNIRLALFNWLFAMKYNGSVILRFDDTDTIRSKQQFIEACKSDLSWLGFNFDKTEFQSKRLSRYIECANLLKQEKVLYPCFETQEDLSLQRKMQLRSGKPPVYDRSSLKLSKNKINDKIKKGLKPHWRLLLDNTRKIEFNDLCRGEVKISLSTISDPVLIRENDNPMYTFTSVVDDIDFKISHIIRGEDHVVNTAVQIYLFELLLKVLKNKNNIPIFAHLSLILNDKGKPLSKRDNSIGIQQLRSSGIEPETLITYLSALGGNESPLEIEANLLANNSDNNVSFLKLLANNFNFSYYGRNAPRLQVSDLALLNKKRLSSLNYFAVKNKLLVNNITLIQEQHWNVLRNEINILDDLNDWTSCFMPNFKSTIQNLSSNNEIFNISASILKNTDWNQKDISIALQSIQKDNNLKKPELYRPLRQAISGKNKGPSLDSLMHIIGKTEVLKRIKSHT